MLADVQIPRGETADAEPGEMVTVEITRWPTPTRGPIGRIIEVLGGIDEPGVDTEIILRKHGIPDEHSRGSHRRGAPHRRRRSRSATCRGRTDFRDRLIVTIDGEHARDFDDAISIERLANGHYLARRPHRRRRALRARRAARSTQEAYERGTSVYFPERAVHMFPDGARDRPVQPAIRTSIGWCSRA